MQTLIYHNHILCHCGLRLPFEDRSTYKLCSTGAGRQDSGYFNDSPLHEVGALTGSQRAIDFPGSVTTKCPGHRAGSLTGYSELSIWATLAIMASRRAVE